MSDLNPLHPAEAAESSIFWFYDNLIYKIKNEEKENLSMAKEKKFVQAITSRDEDFAQWYTDVVREAKLCDYSSVKGCLNYLPNGYAIWEKIQADLDKRFKETGVENVYLPMLIPENLLISKDLHRKLHG
jgi:threonyl-tRNA synthetase